MRTPAIALPLLLAAASLAACASPSPPPPPISMPTAGVGAPLGSLEPPIAPAQDASGKSFDRTGAYLGLYGLKSWEDFDDTDSGISTGDSDLGAGMKFGLRMTPAFGIEAFGELVEGFDVDSNSVEADLELAQVGLLAKLYLGDGRFQPYLAAGGGMASAEIDDFDSDDDGGFFRGAVGLDVYVTENVALFAEGNYDHMVGGTSDLDHLNALLGLMFRF
ncbi:MAG TPA: outer membrane beta-barrel protein [Planctomycetota bacterium]|nr:outer membrane beta-barrel protein [Planctomycetota bacterium]